MANDMQSPEASAIARKEVLDFLDSEIVFHRAREKETSWPRWGIVLACGGIAWALLERMIAGKWSPAGCASVVLLGAGLWKVLTAVRDWIESLGGSSREGYRFRWIAELLEGPRLWLVLQLGVAVGHLALVPVIWMHTHWIGRLVPILLGVGEMAGALAVIALIYRRADFPVPSGIGPTTPIKLAMLVNVLLGGALAAAFWTPAVRAGAVNQEAGVLLLVLVFLLLRYAYQLKRNPLLGALEGLRYQFALGTLSPDRAMHRAEAIIDGLPLEGLFGKELAEVLVQEGARLAAADKVRRALAAAREAISEALGASVVEERRLALRVAKSRFDAVQKDLEHARTVLSAKHAIASKLLPAMGVELPASVSIPVLDGVLGEVVDLDLELKCLDLELNAGAAFEGQRMASTQSSPQG